MSQTKKHCEPLVAVWLRPSTTEPCICCKQVAEKPRGEHLKNDDVYLPCKQVGRILLFIFDSLLCVISSFTCIFITKQHKLLCGLCKEKIHTGQLTINCFLLQLPNYALDENLMCSQTSTEIERQYPFHAHDKKSLMCRVDKWTTGPERLEPGSIESNLIEKFYTY